MTCLPHASHVSSVLAQNGGFGSVFISSLALVLLLMAMFFGISTLRKWVKKDNEADAPQLGFTLGDLRRMRDEGQITEEEFERARTQMISATQRAAERAAAQAAETARNKGVTSAPVTDIEELRQRARRHRTGTGHPPADPAPPSEDPSPPAP